MTVIVGVLCEDGVVIGSDSSATFVASDIKTVEQPTKKVNIVHDDVIVAGTGEVGLGQRFTDLVTQLRATDGFTKAQYLEIGRTIAKNACEDFANTHAKGGFGALVAFCCAGKFYLCEFQVSDLQPEFKTPDQRFVSMGSGQMITDPFLGFLRRVFFPNNEDIPKLTEGVFLVTWALENAFDLNPGGIKEPAQIAVLENDTDAGRFKARLLNEDELQEHKSSAEGAEAHLAMYRNLLGGEDALDIPSLES